MSNRPRFARAGRELSFLSEQRDSAGPTRGQLNVVAVAADPFTVGIPQTLFAVGADGGPSMSEFHAASDGRLLMTRRVAQAPGNEAHAVLRQN